MQQSTASCSLIRLFPISRSFKYMHIKFITVLPFMQVDSNNIVKPWSSLNRFFPSPRGETRRTKNSELTQCSNPVLFQGQFDREDLVPLLQSLGEENQQLKNQKSSLRSDMERLDGLSRSLLSSNQQLRKHYWGRSEDTRKLISTLIVQFNQNLEDYQQTIDSYRGINLKMVTEIANHRTRIAQTQHRIGELSQLIQYSKLQLLKNQKDNSDRVIRNQHNANKMSQILSMRGNYPNIDKLETEVNELTVGVTKTRQNNLSSLRLITKLQADSNNPECLDKPSASNIQHQLLSPRKDSNKPLPSRHLQTQQQKRQLELDWNCKIMKLSNVKEQCRASTKLVQSVKCKHQLNSELINKRKYEINILKIEAAKYAQKRRSLRLQQAKRVNEVRLTHEKIIDDLKNRIRNQGKPVKMPIFKNNRIEELKGLYNDLEHAVAEMQIRIQKQPNPIGQLLAISHTMGNSKFRS